MELLFLTVALLGSSACALAIGFLRSGWQISHLRLLLQLPPVQPAKPESFLLRCGCTLWDTNWSLLENIQKEEPVGK